MASFLLYVIGGVFVALLLAAIIVLEVFTEYSPVDWYSRAVIWLLTLPRRAAVSLVEAIVDTWVSDSPSYSTKLLSLLLVVTGFLAALGIAGLVFTQARIQGSSAPALITFFDLVTNLWLWVIALLVLLRGLLFFQDRSLAQITASVTNYSYTTVRRFAEEARKPDMSVATRVLVQTGDSVEQIEEWLLGALKDGDGHENPVFETEAADDVDEDPEVSGELPAGREPEADEQPSWVRRRLMLLDIKSALDFETVLWRFGAPATLAFIVQLAAVQIWVRWWVYPILAVTSAFVGAAWYYVSDYRYRRRLRSLRQEGEDFYWGDLAILCKRIDVPETTMYYAWFAGKTYASPDPDELAHTLAVRADELVNERYKHPSPAIEEKFAEQLQEYVPTLGAWRNEVELPDIGDTLVETVNDSTEGLLPKNHLIEAVVNEGRTARVGGLVVTGVGHDPALVEQCYRDLVEARALVEVPIKITGGDGTTNEVTAVRLGDDPLPVNMASLRANFSERFQGMSLESRYSIDDVGQVTPERKFVRPTSTTSGGD